MAIQPAAVDERIEAILTRRKDAPGALLPVLHDIQDALGHVPAGAVPAIAAALILSRAEVHGVITYYHWFRQQPAGRHVVRICRAEACQSRGAEALLAHAETALGCASHGTSGDGVFTLEPVYCLGQCACGPAVMVDEAEIHLRVTPARFDALVGQKRGKE
jgi:formate dehydrogenase subunit gamma